MTKNYEAFFNSNEEKIEEFDFLEYESDRYKDKKRKSRSGLVLNVPYDIIINKFFGDPQIDINGAEVTQLIFQLVNSDTNNEGFIVDINDIRRSFFDRIGRFIQNTTLIEKGVQPPPTGVLLWPRVIIVPFSPSFENISRFIFCKYAPIVKNKFNVDLVSVTTSSSIGSATFFKRRKRYEE